MVLTLYESKSLNKNASSIKVPKRELETLLKQQNSEYIGNTLDHPESGNFGDCGIFW